MSVKDWTEKGVILTPKLTFKSEMPLDARTLELLRKHKVTLLQELTAPAGSIPRLPQPLESLIRAASSNLLPRGTVMMASGLIPDLSTHTIAWAAAYLLGDREHALTRLWEARKAWQQERAS